MTSRLLGRRHSTPVRSTESSRSGNSLPSDVVGQTCRRVGIVGLVFAALWALHIFMNTVVARWFGEMAIMPEQWPFPGLPVAMAGLVSSILMTMLARRFSSQPRLLVDLGSGYLVLQCLLVSIISQWAPVPISPRVSWVLGLHPDSVLPGHCPQHPEEDSGHLAAGRLDRAARFWDQSPSRGLG